MNLPRFGTRAICHNYLVNYFPQEGNMKILACKFGITLAVIVILLALGGCQPASKTPEETVVAEGEVVCPLIDFQYTPGTQVVDPEYGNMERGVLVSWKWNCSVPYLKGHWVGIQDMYSDVTTGHWTGDYEGVTEEGGVWKGLSEIKPPLSIGTSEGEGKYKGLKISTEINMDGYSIKYRVTQLVENK
jgi:hypothetical protein